MKVLVIGAGGFIGHHVSDALSQEHEVVKTSARLGAKGMEYLDLHSKDSILEAVTEFNPQAIVNCAGIIANDESARKNVTFTENLLNSIHKSGLGIKKIVLAGSASVYGIVDHLPVHEDVSLNPVSVYGKAKAEEEQRAFELANSFGLPVVVARIFNPIGPNMNEKQLIPNLVRQVREIREGKATAIEVSRLDAKRDYIDARDVATAMKALVENESKYAVYNVGTGRSVSTRQLIQLILANNQLSSNIELSETAEKPEAMVASQADITRIETEYSWQPNIEIAQTVKEIAYAAGF